MHVHILIITHKLSRTPIALELFDGPDPLEQWFKTWCVSGWFQLTDTLGPVPTPFTIEHAIKFVRGENMEYSTYVREISAYRYSYPQAIPTDVTPEPEPSLKRGPRQNRDNGIMSGDRPQNMGLGKMFKRDYKTLADRGDLGRALGLATEAVRYYTSQTNHARKRGFSSEYMDSSRVHWETERDRILAIAPELQPVREWRS